MPAKLETQFALSALPPAMRDQATVYVLDPNTGYQLSRPGTSGVTCLVERTAWEQADFRNDNRRSPLLRRRGHKDLPKSHYGCCRASHSRNDGLVALKAEIENRYKNKTYKTSEKPGLSYIAAPIMRTWMNFLTHGLYYAGAAPDVLRSEPHERRHRSRSKCRSFLSVDIHFKEGIAERSYIIHLVGEAEKTEIIADEKALFDDLCAYREFLCLSKQKNLDGAQRDGSSLPR